MNNKSRFMLLLLFFNALLVVILLLSVRNQETRQRIRLLDREITHQIEELATRRSNLIQWVYITATPSPSSAPTRVAALPTSTRPPPSRTPTPAPPTPTRTPRPNTPTPTPVPTSTPPTTPTHTVAPTATATQEPTQTPLPTWTPVPTIVPVVARVELAASKTSLPADGQSVSHIRATLWDNTGALYLPETAVTFSTDRGSFWGAQRVVVLAKEGSAQAELMSSTAAGVAHIHAQAEQIPADVQVTFEPGSPHTLVLSATPLQLNVRQTAALEATVWDAFQNPVADGTVVRFEATLGSLATSQAGTRGGRAQSSLSSAAPGISRVTALAGPATQSLEITFISAMSVTFITPNRQCNQTPVQITISGTGLGAGVSARLGAWPLGVQSSTDDTLVAIVPPDIAAGMYDLTLDNQTGDHASLPNAYEALDCTSPDNTLENGYLGTYGAESEFAPAQGDDDQMQVLFFEVPQGTAQPLYIRVYDPDCGGQLDKQNGQVWDSTFSFTVYGASGTYTDPDARRVHPTTGAFSGMPLDSLTIGQDTNADGQWHNFGPFDASAGEPVGGSRVFKLVVQGNPQLPPNLHAADLNLYQVALSTSDTGNTPPPDTRIWAYSWTYLIPIGQARTPPPLYPYLGPNTDIWGQNNWDFDRHDQNAGIQIVTPARTIQLGYEHVSEDNSLQSSSQPVQGTERGTTWAVHIWTDPGQLADNLVTFWATDAQGQALPVFARSTTRAPP